MNSVVFSYLASDKLREGEFVETGTRDGRDRQLTVEGRDLSQEQRKVLTAAVAYNKTDKWLAQWKGNDLWVNLSFQPIYDPGYRAVRSSTEANFDEALTPDTAIEATWYRIIDFDSAIEEKERHHKTLMAAYEEAVRLIEDGHIDQARKLSSEHKMMDFYVNGLSINMRLRSIADEKERAAKERREARKAELAASKAEWISAYGSPHLQEAFRRGYDSQRPYVIERAGQEAPGWQVDFNDSADWVSRSFPTPEALKIEDEGTALVEKIGSGRAPQVVWLKKPPSSQHEDDPYYFEQCEAVVVSNYLDQYDLIKVV